MTPHGTLALSSPWCRQAFPDYTERRAIAERIHPDYTVGVAAHATHRGWYVWVVEHGATIMDSRVVRERKSYGRNDLRRGIDVAIEWIDARTTATYADTTVDVA